jgi:cullin 1
LAKRLVNGTSVGDDAETSMIGKLKTACGFEYTTKLQRMFTDMGLSKDLNTAFKEQTHVATEMADFDFNILVLGSSNWPLTAASSGFTLPNQVFYF